MKRIQRIICGIIIIFMVILLIQVADDAETMNSFTMTDSEVYELNHNWVLTTTEGTQEVISLPYSTGGGSQEGIEPPEGMTEEADVEPPEEMTGDAAAGLPEGMTGDAVAGLPEGMTGDAVTEPRQPQGDLPVDKTITLENTIPEEYWGWMLKFSTNDRQISITIDGETVYSGVGTKWDFWGMPSENTVQYVNIPEDLTEGKIVIKMSARGFGSGNSLEEIDIAKRDIALLKLLQDNLLNIGCSMLMLISGAILLFLAFIQRVSRQSSQGMLHIGLYGINVSVYYIFQTQIIGLFYENQVLLNQLIYLGLMLAPLLLSMYYERRFYPHFHKGYLVFFWLGVGNIGAQMVLQFTGTIQMNQLSVGSYAVILLTMVFAGADRFIELIRRRDYNNILDLIAVTAFVASHIVDFVIMYATDSGKEVEFGRYGTTLFCLIMTVVHLMHVSRGYSYSVEENARLLKREVEMMEKQNSELQKAKEEAEEARKEAIAANEAKGKFLANMSHEIRTPINAVLGMDTMILRESTDMQIKGYALDIQSAGQSLLSLINDILDFSKIESGKMEIIPVEYDFSSLLHDVVNMIRTKAEAKNLELKISINESLPSFLYGDDVRIRQILINLLTNAVKYTPEGSVTLRVDGDVCGNFVTLHFSVEDTGIGIRKEDIQKLFVEFERIEEKRNRNIEGTGLGMNITTQLLSLMGSGLHVESVYGEGSRFYFDLKQEIRNTEPIGNLEERMKNQTMEYTYQVSFAAPEARVLVVDDNAINRRVFRSLLKQTQVQVDEAESGKECLRLVAEKHYDLIFLDHMMPEMDGIETLHHMKEMQDYPCEDTPVIVLTANAVTGAREMYLSQGFDDFLSKPVKPEKLEQMVAQMLPQELVHKGELAVSSIGAAKQTEKQQTEEKQIEEKQTDDRKQDAWDSIDSLPQIDGIDWNYGWMHLPDMELLKNTVQDFYHTIEAEADCLEEYYKGMIDIASDEKSDKLELYRIKVHSMKNSAALIGIVPLAGMAKILEQAAREDKIEKILQLTPTFLQEWRAYKEKLQICITSGEEEKQEIGDTSVIAAYLGLLKQAMEAMDIDAADEAMKLLMQYRYSDEMMTDMQALGHAVTNLDSGLAAELIDEITGRIRG